MSPWGHIEWLLEWYPARKWTVISAISFESRCTAAIEFLVSTTDKFDQVYVLRIDDPPNIHTQVIRDRTDQNRYVLDSCLEGISHIAAHLMEPPSRWDKLVTDICRKRSRSVILDVSTLPKRIALFVLRQLLRNDSVKDIIVCYTRAGGYREGPLSYDERPPETLPGFGHVESGEKQKVFIVSVGYTRFDLRQVLKETSSRDIFFLMPFPPASPSSRRTWRFLKMLNEDLGPTRPVLRRFNAIDMFATYQWLVGNMRPDALTTMLPLGPKPHSIAMALAQLKHQECSQLVYPQPQRYHPDYSAGTHMDFNGRPSILGYALRRDYHDVLGVVD